MGNIAQVAPNADDAGLAGRRLRLECWLREAGLNGIKTARAPRRVARLAACVGAIALLATACGGSSKPTDVTSGGGDVNATKTRVVALHATAVAKATTSPKPASPVAQATVRVNGSPVPSGQVTPTSGPPPTPSTFGLGFVHRWNPLFFQAAVYAVDVDTSAPPVDDKTVIAVDAEECQQDDAPADRLQPAQPNDFHLTLADGSDVPPSNATATHADAFAVTQLKAGQCVRGWISYELPAGASAERVVFKGKVNIGKAIATVTGYWSTTQTQ
jgi:hypothetical protein